MTAGSLATPFAEPRPSQRIPLVLGAAAAALAALVVVSPWAGAFLGAAIVFVFSTVENEAFLLLIVFLTPVDIILKPGSLVADVAVSAHALVAVGFFAGRLWRGQLRLTELWESPLTRASFLFLGTVSVSVLLGSAAQAYTRQSVRGAYFLASYVAFYLVMFVWLKNSRRLLRRVVLTLFASTIVVAAFGILQATIGGYTALWFLLYPPGNIQFTPWNGRVPSFLGYGNHLAAYLNLVLPIALAVHVLAKESLWKGLAAWTLALGVVALVLAQSRGGFAGFGCILVLAILHFSKSWRKRIAFMLGFVLFVLGAYWISTNWDLGHWGQVRDMSTWGRLLLWAVLWRLFLHSPIHGVGFGTFPSLYGSYIPSSWGIPASLEGHNIYFELLGETGILGFVGFLWLVRIAVSEARQQLYSADWFGHALGFGVVAAIVAAVVYGFVDHALFWNPQIGILFWLWLAVVAQRPAMPVTSEVKQRVNESCELRML